MSKHELELPNDPNAEAGILSACLIEKKAIVSSLSAGISETDFYRHSHKMVFRSIEALYRDGIAVDLITLTSHMKKNKTFDKAGGFEFFNKLTSVVVSGSHVKAHIDIVKETSKLRQFSLLAKTMADDQTSGLTSEELCQKYNSEVAKIMAEGGDNTVLIGDVCDILEKKYDEGIELLESFPTYLDCLDYYVTMSVGNVVVIASRPAMGKSSLARQLSYNWSAIGRHKVLVFTLEMDVEEFAIGMQSMAGEIPSEQIYKHLMNEFEMARSISADDTLRFANIRVNDAGKVTPEMCRQVLDKAESDGEKFDIMIVDYLQLMSAVGKFSSRQQEISEITRGLKIIAKEKKILIIALSQLNRQVESREDKRPSLADLRESGAIEQDADKVIFLYRDWVYHTISNENDMEFLIRKNRQGKIGVGHAIFYPETTRFADKKWYKEDL